MISSAAVLLQWARRAFRANCGSVDGRRKMCTRREFLAETICGHAEGDESVCLRNNRGVNKSKPMLALDLRRVALRDFSWLKWAGGATRTHHATIRAISFPLAPQRETEMRQDEQMCSKACLEPLRLRFWPPLARARQTPPPILQSLDG